MGNDNVSIYPHFRVERFGRGDPVDQTQACAVCASTGLPVRSSSITRFQPMLRATATAGVEQKRPTVTRN
jgi:hypothetical protein